MDKTKRIRTSHKRNLSCTPEFNRSEQVLPVQQRPRSESFGSQKRGCAKQQRVCESVEGKCLKSGVECGYSCASESPNVSSVNCGALPPGNCFTPINTGNTCPPTCSLKLADQLQLNETSLQNCIIGDLQITDDVIGIGSYGEVRKAYFEGLVVAAKRPHQIFQEDGHLHPRVHECFLDECMKQTNIRHPNLVQFLGIYFDQQANGSPVLVTELMKCSLTSLLSSQQSISMTKKLKLAQDIIQGLCYLHSRALVHRDLSSNNILLTDEHRAKIADLGVARACQPDGLMTTCTRCPGSLVYMPPEALSSQPDCNKTIDIFSFGVLLVQIVTRNFPHPTDSFMEVKVSQNGNPLHERIPEVERRKSDLDLMKTILEEENGPIVLYDLAFECLQNSPQNRPQSVLDICNALEKMISQAEQTSAKQPHPLHAPALQQTSYSLSQCSQVLVSCYTDKSPMECANDSNCQPNEEIQGSSALVVADSDSCMVKPIKNLPAKIKLGSEHTQETASAPKVSSILHESMDSNSTPQGPATETCTDEGHSGVVVCNNGKVLKMATGSTSGAFKHQSIEQVDLEFPEHCFPNSDSAETQLSSQEYKIPEANDHNGIQANDFSTDIKIEEVFQEPHMQVTAQQRSRESYHNPDSADMLCPHKNTVSDSLCTSTDYAAEGTSCTEDEIPKPKSSSESLSTLHNLIPSKEIEEIKTSSHTPVPGLSDEKSTTKVNICMSLQLYTAGEADRNSIDCWVAEDKETKQLATEHICISNTQIESTTSRKQSECILSPSKSFSSAQKALQCCSTLILSCSSPLASMRNQTFEEQMDPSNHCSSKIVPYEDTISSPAITILSVLNAVGSRPHFQPWPPFFIEECWLRVLAKRTFLSVIISSLPESLVYNAVKELPFQQNKVVPLLKTKCTTNQGSLPNNHHSWKLYGPVSQNGVIWYSRSITASCFIREHDTLFPSRPTLQHCSNMLLPCLSFPLQCVQKSFVDPLETQCHSEFGTFPYQTIPNPVLLDFLYAVNALRGTPHFQGQLHSPGKPKSSYLQLLPKKTLSTASKNSQPEEDHIPYYSARSLTLLPKLDDVTVNGHPTVIAEQDYNTFQISASSDKKSLSLPPNSVGVNTHEKREYRCTLGNGVLVYHVSLTLPRKLLQYYVLRKVLYLRVVLIEKTTFVDFKSCLPKQCHAPNNKVSSALMATVVDDYLSLAKEYRIWGHEYSQCNQPLPTQQLIHIRPCSTLAVMNSSATGALLAQIAVLLAGKANGEHIIGTMSKTPFTYSLSHLIQYVVNTAWEFNTDPFWTFYGQSFSFQHQHTQPWQPPDESVIPFYLLSRYLQFRFIVPAVLYELVLINFKLWLLLHSTPMYSRTIFFEDSVSFGSARTWQREEPMHRDDTADIISCLPNRNSKMKVLNGHGHHMKSLPSSSGANTGTLSSNKVDKKPNNNQLVVGVPATSDSEKVVLRLPRDIKETLICIDPNQEKTILFPMNYCSGGTSKFTKHPHCLLGPRESRFYNQTNERGGTNPIPRSKEHTKPTLSIPPCWQNGGRCFRILSTEKNSDDKDDVSGDVDEIVSSSKTPNISTRQRIGCRDSMAQQKSSDSLDLTRSAKEPTVLFPWSAKCSFQSLETTEKSTETLFKRLPGAGELPDDANTLSITTDLPPNTQVCHCFSTSDTRQSRHNESTQQTSGSNFEGSSSGGSNSGGGGGVDDDSGGGSGGSSSGGGGSSGGSSSGGGGGSGGSSSGGPGGGGSGGSSSGGGGGSGGSSSGGPGGGGSGGSSSGGGGGSGGSNNGGSAMENGGGNDDDDSSDERSDSDGSGSESSSDRDEKERWKAKSSSKETSHTCSAGDIGQKAESTISVAEPRDLTARCTGDGSSFREQKLIVHKHGTQQNEFIDRIPTSVIPHAQPSTVCDHSKKELQRPTDTKHERKLKETLKTDCYTRLRYSEDSSSLDDERLNSGMIGATATLSNTPEKLSEHLSTATGETITFHNHSEMPTPQSGIDSQVHRHHHLTDLTHWQEKAISSAVDNLLSFQIAGSDSTPTPPNTADHQPDCIESSRPFSSISGDLISITHTITSYSNVQKEEGHYGEIVAELVIGGNTPVHTSNTSTWQELWDIESLDRPEQPPPFTESYKGINQLPIVKIKEDEYEETIQPHLESSYDKKNLMVIGNIPSKFDRPNESGSNPSLEVFYTSLFSSLLQLNLIHHQAILPSEIRREIQTVLHSCYAMPVRLVDFPECFTDSTISLKTYLEYCLVSGHQSQWRMCAVVAVLLECRLVFEQHNLSFTTVLSASQIDLKSLVIETAYCLAPQSTTDFVLSLVNYVKNLLLTCDMMAQPTRTRPMSILHHFLKRVDEWLRGELDPQRKVLLSLSRELQPSPYS